MTLNLEREARHARVAVCDQGTGIPDTELESIFDKFVQSSKTNTGAGGTGLGLAICREIITEHAGRIWVDNRADGGAMFTFELPLPADDLAAGELAANVPTLPLAPRSHE